MLSFPRAQYPVDEDQLKSRDRKHNSQQNRIRRVIATRNKSSRRISHSIVIVMNHYQVDK